jgi:hypothetical protein
MCKYVRSKGAIFLVGLTRTNPNLEQFLKQFSIPFVDVTTSLRYEGHGGHWTPEGHTFVCDNVEQMLREGGFIDNAEPPGSNQHVQ